MVASCIVGVFAEIERARSQRKEVDTVCMNRIGIVFVFIEPSVVGAFTAPYNGYSLFRVGFREQIASNVEPIVLYSCYFRREHPCSSVTQTYISNSVTKHVESIPSIHRLTRRLLVVAVLEPASTTSPRVASVRVEASLIGKEGVFAVTTRNIAYLTKRKV